MKTRNLLAATLTAFAGYSASATLVAYFPVNSATDSSNFLDDIIDDAGHGVADGTSANVNASIIFDATRNGDVLSTVEGHRYTAGTQDIDLNLGFTWSLWVNVASSNISDAGADVIIGTRNGSPWHKMDLTTIQNWNGNVPGAGSYATLADDTWHHLAYVGDANNRRLYKDGVMIAQDLNFTIATFNGVMEIGGSSKFNEDVTGLYDDIAIWNERLSEEDILALASGTKPDELGGVALPGDTDNDGDLDDSDLGTSLANYTGPVGNVGKTAAEGDTDADGDVDDSDLGTSFANYTGPLAAPVPEPTSLALLSLGGLMIARRRRA